VIEELKNILNGQQPNLDNLQTNSGKRYVKTIAEFNMPEQTRKEIIKYCDSDSNSNCDNKNIIAKPIDFNGEHLADVIVCPGPYSPRKNVINKFLDFVIMHIDDFVYGDIIHKRRIFKLEAEIAELKNQQIFQ